MTLVGFAATRGPHAATFKVNSTGDAHDERPGDHRCASAGGACTLRAAIEETHAAASPQKIVIMLTRPSTIRLEHGELAIEEPSNVTIQGPGPSSLTIEANRGSRVLRVGKGAIAFVSGMTLTGGCPLEAHNNVDERRSSLGGGILNLGTLALSRVAVKGNAAQDGGGGIWNGGTLRMAMSKISDNTCPDRDGGGLVNEGLASLYRSTISGNTAANFAGGILNNGSLTLTETTVAGNDAPVGGGGIDNGGRATLSRSAVIGNTSADHAAGIDNRGTMTLLNTTISGNRGRDEVGGIGNSGTLGLYNCTISANLSDGAGGLYASGGSITIANSIVAGNSAASGMINPQADCSLLLPSVLHSFGYNILGERTGCITGGGSEAVSELDHTIPPESLGSLLGPLQDNGGPTPTHALLVPAINPAVDQGNPYGCACLGALIMSDQRGRRRPSGPHGVTQLSSGPRCDIGAYEAQRRAGAGPLAVRSNIESP